MPPYDNKPKFSSEGERVEAMLEKTIPSQVPFNCTRESYQRMLMHTKLFDPGPNAIWGCEKTGARIHAKVSWRTIWNRDGSLNATHVPVAVLFCSSCDKPPQVAPEAALWTDMVQTLSM